MGDALTFRVSLWNPDIPRWGIAVPGSPRPPKQVGNSVGCTFPGEC